MRAFDMSKTEYLRKAEECAERAMEAGGERDRVTWLKLAEGYLSLAASVRKAEADETFEAHLLRRGTHHKPSDSSH